MITFLIGILILILGYVFYSKYVEKQFCPSEQDTPAISNYDGVDYLPLSTKQNMLIQLLNIAGSGPILGGIQGVLFGPIAFLLIPIGCIFMGSVHDYFSGMLSVRNKGAQITELIQKYLGKNIYKIFLVIVSVMLLFLGAVFVYTSGDIIADDFFGITDFSLTNPTILFIYAIILFYFILATLLPIDKIIGRFYPFFAIMLLLGSLFIVIGFFTKGVNLQELDIHHINLNPNKLHILPMFFMTVCCGLLSGFHSTQSTLISKTLKKERDGKKVFYGMMCIESLIAMVWAAAAMHVYSLNILPAEQIGTAYVINDIADTFVTPWLAFVVTLAVVILPITSGDTALRSLRITIADAINLKQNLVVNRLKIIIPITVFILGILFWAKCSVDSFPLLWRYFTFGNQLIAIPTFICATIYLHKTKKNYLITLLPGLFYIFIVSAFIYNSKIGFNLPYEISNWFGVLTTLICLFFIIKKIKNPNKF